MIPVIIQHDQQYIFEFSPGLFSDLLAGTLITIL